MVCTNFYYESTNFLQKSAYLGKIWFLSYDPETSKSITMQDSLRRFDDTIKTCQ